MKGSLQKTNLGWSVTKACLQRKAIELVHGHPSMRFSVAQVKAWQGLLIAG